MLRVGAHVSIAGGYTNALNKIKDMGGNCLQIFSASPRAWNFARPAEHEIDEFIALKKKLDINPVYFHASYLINLAVDNRMGKLSKQLLQHELNIAHRLGVKGSIIHLGSFKESVIDYKDIVALIKEVLAKTSDDILFVIENAGTKKIGQKLDEIATIVKMVHSERVKVCLDTCHLHAAGYDLRGKKNFENFLLEFDTLIGLQRLELVHMNDSKDPFGSGRDRHENIGEGQVGIEVFKEFLTHPKTKHLPFIIEVPGFDDNGPDKKNIDILKSLAG